MPRRRSLNRSPRTGRAPVRGSTAFQGGCWPGRTGTRSAMTTTTGPHSGSLSGQSRPVGSSNCASGKCFGSARTCRRIGGEEQIRGKCAVTKTCLPYSQPPPPPKKNTHPAFPAPTHINTTGLSDALQVPDAEHFVAAAGRQHVALLRVPVHTQHQVRVGWNHIRRPVFLSNVPDLTKVEGEKKKKKEERESHFIQITTQKK